MITIICSWENEVIKKVVIFGHSEYLEWGKDIVCSAVSGIVFGTINFLYEKYPYFSKVSFSSARIIIRVVVFNDSLQLCLCLMLYQLKNIEKIYSKYLKIIMKGEKSII